MTGFVGANDRPAWHHGLSSPQLSSNRHVVDLKKWRDIDWLRQPEASRVERKWTSNLTERLVEVPAEALSEFSHHLHLGSTIRIKTIGAASRST